MEKDLSMMLYESMMEDVVMMDAQTVSDGLGGFIRVWTEGAAFKAAISKDTSTQGRLAEKEGLTEIYTVTTYRSTPLSFHDVIKRKKNGQILRITSNEADNESPQVATFSMAQVSAEAWVLTSD